MALTPLRTRGRAREVFSGLSQIVTGATSTIVGLAAAPSAAIKAVEAIAPSAGRINQACQLFEQGTDLLYRGIPFVEWVRPGAIDSGPEIGAVITTAAVGLWLGYQLIANGVEDVGGYTGAITPP